MVDKHYFTVLTKFEMYLSMLGINEDQGKEEKDGFILKILMFFTLQLFFTPIQPGPSYLYQKLKNIFRFGQKPVFLKLQSQGNPSINLYHKY